MKELECVVQKYAWGKIGFESTVAQLKDSADSKFTVNPEDTYAELWMGTHSSGPSKVIDDDKLLSEWLEEHPEAGGKYHTGLPFLFKVLSIQKALSIQAHPDLQLAQVLHTNFPDLYKDPNHKPEMAIAVTEFEALCQFREIEEIIEHIKEVPELGALVDSKIVNELCEKKDKASLRNFFKNFIYADATVRAIQLKNLRERLNKASRTRQLSSIEALVLRLDDQFKDDIGVFCPYILNYITMQPGDAVYLGANEPHAYLSGDCVECMACSDNVVRAGLTPKFIDKVTLVKMLTYDVGYPSIISGEKVDENTRIYSPPIPEFEVERISMSAHSQYAAIVRTGPCLLLVLTGQAKSGDGLNLKRGGVYFVSANEQVTFVTEESDFVAYRASPNERIEEEEAHIQQ